MNTGLSHISAMPRELLVVLSVAFILAQCSACAIWWARSTCPPHAKATAVALACGFLWLVLVNLLESTRGSGVAALAWAVCIAVQVVLTGFGVTGLELLINYRCAAGRSRCSLQYLFVWTTLLAIVLGGAGAIANKFGFQLADVPNWEFFAQLQAVAVASALVASAVYTSVRLPQTRLFRGLTSAATIAAGAFIVPVCLQAIFGETIGVQPADLVWLFAGQSLFLLATVVMVTNPPRPLRTDLPH